MNDAQHPQPATLQNALEEVIVKAALRQDRMAEILTQVNVPYAFFASVLNLQPGRHRFTYEAMSAVFHCSTVVVMQFKHHWAIRRPADRSALVQPVLVTPGHGSYPAGHAVQCHFVAAVLKQLLTDAEKINVGPDAGNPPAATAPNNGNGHMAETGEELIALADRIGMNRVIAGLHYVDDLKQGRRLGERLADYFVFKTKTKGSALNWLWTKATNEQWR